MNNKLIGKTVLLINAGNIRKLFILKIMKKNGLKVVCLDSEVKELAKEYVDDWIVADLMDDNACVNKIRSYLKSGKEIDGVITFWDECVSLSAKIAEEFKWTGIPFGVVEKIKNKYNFRLYCKESSIPTPKARIIKNDADINVIAKEMKFPIVLKPVFGASSAFVVKVSSVKKVKETVEYIKKNIETFYLAAEWKNFEVMAEEYISGQEIDIDLLIQNGELKYSSITDNEKTDEPFFVEKGQSIPSILKKDVQKEVMDKAFGFLKKLGVNNGCVHFEGKVVKSFLMPIEANLRMGGGDVYLFSKFVWGVDLVENAIKVALGIDVEIKKPNKPLTYLWGRQFLSKDSCLIEDIKIDEKLYKKSYYFELYFLKKIGDTFFAPPRGYDTAIGWFTASGKSLRQAKENWFKAKKMVRIKMKKI